MADIRDTLYHLAERADRRYSTVIAARTGGKHDRWTMTKADERIPEIIAAYRDKLNADQSWLMYLRTEGSK